MKKKSGSLEARVIFIAITIIFISFLIIPMMFMLLKTVQGTDGSIFSNFINIFNKKGFGQSVINSVVVSLVSAIITTILAFFMAYTIHFTNLSNKIKGFIKKAVVLPMLLPTITYGFAIIYSFGKQGLITKIFGMQFFDIYGFQGLLLGYIVYTLPISFLLIHNTMGYIDKKFLIVSRVMGDTTKKTFWMTIIRPLLGTFVASLVQCFTLAFTDYGIPAAIGGEYQVVASTLYNEMLGSIPNFNQGAVVALVMLIPSIISISLIRYIEKYNIRYDKVSKVESKKNKVRDVLCLLYSSTILITIFAIFAVIFVVAFVKGWPYDTSFTLDNFKNVFGDPTLIGVYKNSLLLAGFSALFGTLLAYGGALVTTRSKLPAIYKRIIEGFALITNTIPGMVIGIAYLLLFSGTSLQNTLLILIISNVIHFFSTPYLMMKNSLEKMNASFEVTAKLMGDSWFKTLIRVITPNAKNTLIEVFSYYFVNAMVTVSAVIFLAGAMTMVITTKIKELQHFANFSEIFVLSILILVTNVIAKAIFRAIEIYNEKRIKA